jgi:hypothetical protein
MQTEHMLSLILELSKVEKRTYVTLSEFGVV